MRLRRFPLRIRFRHRQIWVSELAGILIVGHFLLALGAIALVAFGNERTIARNSRRIAELKRDEIALRHSLDKLGEKGAIATVLRRFTNDRLPTSTVRVLTRLVHESSTTYGYDPLLLLAVIYVESVFDPDALGRYRSGEYSGAVGLMQLKFATAKEVARDLGMTLETEKDLLVPEINVALGVAYLTRMTALFKDLKLGILAYNQGPGTILQSLQGDRPLSIRYYEKVLRAYYRLSEESRGIPQEGG